MCEGDIIHLNYVPPPRMAIFKGGGGGGGGGYSLRGNIIHLDDAHSFPIVLVEGLFVLSVYGHPQMHSSRFP